MTAIHKIANLKAILKASRLYSKELREKARDSHRKLLAQMQEVAADPRLAHLRYCEVGRLYIEQERYTTLADLSQGSCLTLRQEIATLVKQLANE